MTKRNVLILILIWLNITIAFTNDGNLFNKAYVPDSFKIKLNSAKSIESKIDILNDIGYFLSGRDPENALNISRIALKISDSLGYKVGLFSADNNIGISFYRRSKYKQALTYFNLAGEIAKDINSKAKLAAVYSNMALVYNLLADYNKALRYNFEALEIRLLRKDTAAIAISYNNIGTTYHYKSDYREALEYYKKALDLKKTQHDKEGIASTYNNIGQLFFEMYTNTTSWTLDSALKYYMKSYYSWNLTSNRAGLSEVLPNIGNVYSLQNHNDRAFDAYNAALNYQKQTGDSAGIALTFYNMGLLYYHSSNYKLAKEYLNMSVKIARKYLIADLIKDNLKMLFVLIGAEGDYKSAFNYASEYVRLNDSISELSHTQLIEDYSGKFEYQSSENRKLQADVNRTRIWLKVLISITLLFISFFIFMKFKRKKISQ